MYHVFSNVIQVRSQLSQYLRYLQVRYLRYRRYLGTVGTVGTAVPYRTGSAQPQCAGASPGRVLLESSAGKARHRYMHFLIYMHLPYGEHACNAVVFMSKLPEVKCTNSRSS